MAEGSLSQHWLLPLEVDIQPYCGYSPEEYLSYENQKDDSISVQIRGVNAFLMQYSSREASLQLWAGGSAIHLSTWRHELDMENAAESLLPIAAERPVATLGPLPPPTKASC